MATPIAHKGCTAGAKVQALTMLDLLLKPALVTAGVGLLHATSRPRTRSTSPLVRPQDKPATFLNTKIMAEYREQMKPFYFDPTKYKTYLEQLGVPYPPPVKATGGAVPLPRRSRPGGCSAKAGVPSPGLSAAAGRSRSGRCGRPAADRARAR